MFSKIKKLFSRKVVVELALPQTWQGEQPGFENNSVRLVSQEDLRRSSNTIYIPESDWQAAAESAENVRLLERSVNEAVEYADTLLPPRYEGSIGTVEGARFALNASQALGPPAESPETDWAASPYNEQYAPPRWIPMAQEEIPDQFIPTGYYVEYEDHAAWDASPTALYWTNATMRAQVVANSRGCTKLINWQKLEDTNNG